MAIDVYPVPIEHKDYIRQNMFFKNTEETLKSSIGVNIYQDFAYTQANSIGYLALTTGAAAVFNQWAEFGVFCSYWFPKTEPITLALVSKPTVHLNNNIYCGNTLGFIPWAEKIFHPKFVLDLGIGAATETELTSCTPSGCTGREKKIAYPVFIIKPAILLEMNVFSFLQWTLGVRYRLELAGSGPSDSGTFNSHSSWLEISTGPVFNVR